MFSSMETLNVSREKPRDKKTNSKCQQLYSQALLGSADASGWFASAVQQSIAMKAGKQWLWTA
jgi:hypothetical protein